MTATPTVGPGYYNYVRLATYASEFESISDDARDQKRWRQRMSGKCLTKTRNRGQDTDVAKPDQPGMMALRLVDFKLH